MASIHDAAAQGDIEGIQAALDAGVPVDLVNDGGSTPLLCACEGGYVEAVALLLSFGAQPDSVRADGIFPLEIAAFNGHSDVVAALIAQGASASQSRDGFTALHAVACSGDVAIAKQLVEAGVPLDLRDEDGTDRVPLHWSAQEGHADMCAFLVEKGATIDLPDAHGFTALAQAAGEGHVNVVRVLLDHGADGSVKISGNSGATSLHLACAYGRTEIVRLLLDSGMTGHEEACDGRTPRSNALDGGYSEIVRLIDNLGN